MSGEKGLAPPPPPEDVKRGQRRIAITSQYVIITGIKRAAHVVCGPYSIQLAGEEGGGCSKSSPSQDTGREGIGAVARGLGAAEVAVQRGVDREEHVGRKRDWVRDDCKGDGKK